MSMNARATRPEIRITGGAGPFAAAAIAAVIQRVLDEEQTAAATPLHRQRLSDWVMAGRNDAFKPPPVPATRSTAGATWPV